VAALILFFKKAKKLAVVLKTIIEIFENGVNLLRKTKEDNEKMQSSNDAWKEETKKELKAEMDKRLSAVEKETHETNVGVKKLLKVKRIVYINNPSMVSTGTSHKVAEVLNHDETQKE
jgi:hypothetical protein